MFSQRGILEALGLALVMSLKPQQGTWRQLRHLGWLGWFFVLQSSAGMIFFLTALRHTTVAHAVMVVISSPGPDSGMDL